MLLSFKRCMFLGLLTAAQAVSASEWSPTASDVNFFSFGPFGGWSQTGTIGIFEDNDSISTTSDPVISFSNGATVSFAPNGSDWNITVASTGTPSITAILSASDHFQLGWLSNNAWIPQTGNNESPFTPNFWQLTFIDSSLASNNTQTLYATNIALSDTSAIPISSIPLPAAAWSFMAGMMGFLGLSKRRHS